MASNVTGNKMNSLEYYNRQKEDWGQEEIDIIRDEYVRKELTICQMANIHRRTPGSIAYKLKKIGVIEGMFVARGYTEYKQSRLYNEIKEKATAEKNDKAAKKEYIKDYTSLKDLTTEVQELKKEVSSLKKDVKEVLRLINALYDFETQDE